MEITNEIKAKVFAQYFGHSCITMTRQTQGEGLPSKYLKGILKEIDLDMQDSFIGLLLENEKDFSIHEYYNSHQIKLILRSLSSMTDDDAIEVASIAGISKSYNSQKYILESGLELVANYMRKQSNVHGIYWIRLSQYLTYRGYDLPQYLLGNKTLHEAGLAVYENEII